MHQDNSGHATKTQADSSDQNDPDNINENGSPNTQPDREDLLKPSRRDFLKQTMAGTGFALAPPLMLDPEAHASVHPNLQQPTPVGTTSVSLNINGVDHSLNIELRVTLLDALREYSGMKGTKKGCDHGQCGACTVHVDGRRINSCLTLAIMHQGHKITTIEGLANGEQLHPMQTAFIKHDGFQCGYCTPGQIMSAIGVVNEGQAKTADDIREQMSGNICRCGAYPNIVAAVEEVLHKES